MLVPLPGSSTTRTRVATTTVRGTRIRTITEPTPTRTVFVSTCVRVTATSTLTEIGDASLHHSPSSTSTDTSTSSKTLAVGGEPPPSDSGTKVNVGAIVGGLIGGFLAPFLLVLLLAWLRRKGVFRGLRSRPPHDEMRSVLPIGLTPPLGGSKSASDGALSTSTHRSKGKGTAANTPEPSTQQPPLDRRTSRSSRHSGPEYDRRGAVSPVWPDGQHIPTILPPRTDLRASNTTQPSSLCCDTPGSAPTWAVPWDAYATSPSPADSLDVDIFSSIGFVWLLLLIPRPLSEYTEGCQPCELLRPPIRNGTTCADWWYSSDEDEDAESRASPER
ncbi:hypothetical protein FA13DRAFT_1784362 [Coprinellus micaceus]|uniref:Uncharacterized protein n=1 Tax=Coprinellus micaceus TaxID=71717 RepID=A0A4Y7U0T9_COPMI|nr:hypothetical protein FA13DRAFT_1784362 [Coprinellus micaceus]